MVREHCQCSLDTSMLRHLKSVLVAINYEGGDIKIPVVLPSVDLKDFASRAHCR